MTLPWAIAALLGAAAFPPFVRFDPYYLYVAGTAFLLAAVATAWGLLATAGQVSFGHAVYFGAGAYTSALLAQQAGWNPWLGLLAAGAAGAAVALPIGLTTQRLGGAPLALATLAYAEVGRLVALNWESLTGGGAGLIGIPPLPTPQPSAAGTGAGDRTAGYYVALGFLALALSVFASLGRTRAGLAWAAIREREVRARLLGVSTTPYKLLAFACSGALTGVGGALYAHAVRFIEPDLVFGRGMSLSPLVMATFGGVGTAVGPAVGALMLHLVSELVFQPRLPRLHQLPYALALIAVALYLPGGLAGLTRRRPR